jgi:cytoplasmic iron level regulating protein YaaA (DUF328/UPF0246 family)
MGVGGVTQMSYLILLSPAKKQEYTPPKFSVTTAMPRMLAATDLIVAKLKKLSLVELETTLGVSKKLAELNYERYQEYNLKNYYHNNSCPAIYAYHGDVYRAFDALSLQETEIDFMQNHLRILSGLYGLLRPLDRIKYHRIEMGCDTRDLLGERLHDYWREQVTKLLAADLGAENKVINCASSEYSKAVNRKVFKDRWIDVKFKQERAGKLRSIGLLDKRARGQMARFAVAKRFKDVSGLKKFNVDGYSFATELSTNSEWVFVTKV